LTDLTASADALQTELNWALQQPADELRRLGNYGRAFVETRFSLNAATRTHLDLYSATIANPPTASQRRSTAFRTGKELAKFKVALKLNRIRATADVRRAEEQLPMSAKELSGALPRAQR
jgi:hypothetical protein